MLKRIAIALFFLVPATVSSQGLDAAMSAVVRLSGTRGGAIVRGSGFVVELDRDRATIVTASHVIEGVQSLEVTFPGEPSDGFPVGSVIGMETDNPHGLAVLRVRGNLPLGVVVLSFEVESRPHIGDSLFLLGFPNMDLAPRATQRVLSARRGALLLIDQDSGEGYSGGPVLLGGKVVGVITETDGQTTFAVNAVVARESLEGWGIELGSPHQGTSESSAPTRAQPEPLAVKVCVPGEERTSNGIVFIRICGGTFTMGSAENDSQAYANERPAHQVSLSEFWIGKTEITNSQYRHVVPDHQGDAGLPVVGVSWVDAQAACERLGGRLPTEAEWEYAARAGSQSEWSFGDQKQLLDKFAWYGKSLEKEPHLVGMKKANAWSLYDMHGNVWEWVADWYSDYSETAQADPAGPSKASEKVLRGGAYNLKARDVRSAFRLGARRWTGGANFGFRCALGLTPEPYSSAFQPGGEEPMLLSQGSMQVP